MPWSGNKAPEQNTEEGQSLALWMEDELERFATDQLENVQAVDLRPSYNAPLRPREGMIVYADGTKWNPGNGIGPYYYNASGVWVPVRKMLGPATSTDNALVRWDGTTGDVLQSSDITLGDSDGKLTRAAGISESGTNTNDDAAAGYKGEYLESVITSGTEVSMTTNTQKNITTITLTPGDWDVDAIAYHHPAATTSITRYAASIGTATGTIDSTPGRFSDFYQAALVSAGGTFNNAIPSYRFKVNINTAIFLVGLVTFTVSTLASYGILRARRAR